MEIKSFVRTESPSFLYMMKKALEDINKKEIQSVVKLRVNENTDSNRCKMLQVSFFK